MKIYCPFCHREIATRGKGASERLTKHNATTQLGWKTTVSSEQCDGSEALALPLRIARVQSSLEGLGRSLAEAESALVRATTVRDERAKALTDAREALAALEAFAARATKGGAR